MTKTRSTKDNLCEICNNCIADCEQDKPIVFGDGKGLDNVIECDGFSQNMRRPDHMVLK